jgi:arylsulfatase A-like enzyme
VPPSRTLPRSALGAALAILAWACAAPQPPTGNVVLRFIEDDPQELLATSRVVASRLEAELGPTDAEAARRWRGHDVEILGVVDGALELEQAGDDPWLATDVDLDAGDVVAVEVELSNPGPAEAQLFWAGHWQRFSSRRMLRAAGGRHLGAGTMLYRFEVGDAPEWRGRVRTLRFDLPPGSDRTMRLGAVRIFRWHRDEARFTAATSRPWKVDLGHSTRNALLAPPGTSWDRRFEVPEGASLALACGIQPGHEGAVRFRVLAMAAGLDDTVLLERTLVAASSGAGRWHDEVVDLSRFAGREIDLRLAVDAPGRGAPTRWFPVWGNPEVVAPPADPDRPNVIVVLLDTLRADRLSSYGHPLPTSPRMDAWAASSAVRFASVVAPAPWTLPAHASMFTGLDAVRHGFNFWGTAPPALETTAEILRRHGYTTAAVTGGGLLHPGFGLAQGFDRFDYWSDPDSDREVAWVFERARSWLRGHHERPFFLFVHTYEMHAPHRRRQPHFDELARTAGVIPPPFDLDLVSRPWQGLVAQGDRFAVRRPGDDDWSGDLDEAELETVGLMYDSALALVDVEVGRLLDHLGAIGLRERSLVVVTSDHGEALGEDGRAGHVYLDDFNLMVPLILELPGAHRGGTVVERQVRLIDLAPTILEILGLPVPAGLDGRSLLPLVEDPGAPFPERAWAYAASSNHGLALRRDDGLKYLFPDPAWAQVEGREALYDLAADPGEEWNLAPADPRTEAARGAARATILEQHRGLRLEIRNAGPGVLEGRLTGAWAAHDRVKSADHPGSPVHWTLERPAGFELEPGHRTTLMLGQLTSPEAGLRLSIAGTGGPGPAFEAGFDLERLRTPAAVRLGPDGWMVEEGFEGELDTGLLVTRVGEPAPIVDAGPATDGETLRQLEALGYVD